MANGQIARSCAIGQSTVHDYLKRGQAAGITWPLPEGWDDRRLEEALFGPGVRRFYENAKPVPDFAHVHEELRRHPHLTLRLVWEEYRQAHLDGYAYSRFCELYLRWRQRLDVLRQEHPAGSRPDPLGPITLAVKRAGTRSAGNPHATCDVAGTGNGTAALPGGHRASSRPYQHGCRRLPDVLED